MGRYHDAHRRSLEDPEGFWGAEAGRIDWIEPPTKILDWDHTSAGKSFYRWYSDGVMNTAYNALDRHVAAGRGDQPAIIYDSPVTDTKRSYTYAEVTETVAKLAGAMAARGVTKGDRVILYMPMVPEAVMGMLACARLGAIHSVVFGGFAPNELATRIDDAKPKMILSASCGIEPGRIVAYKPMLDKAIEQARHKVEACLILARPQAEATLVDGRDEDWATAVTAAAPADCVPVKAIDPLYILYTSGTTGQPKGIVRDNGGHAVALSYTMDALYDVRPGDVYWAASDVGWVVGHSYIVYAPLLHGCTTVVFEGKPVGTPDAGTFWRVIAEHRVSVMFTAPTAIRAIKKEDPHAKLIADYDLSCLRAQFLAGERCDPDTIRWTETHLKVPVVDHWWQTETGWAIAGNPLGLQSFPPKPGSATVPMPGWDVQVLDAENRPVPAGDIGAIVAKLPLPPGTLPGLWNADQRFFQAYLADHPGFYKTGDAGFVDTDGYIHVMTRVDDVINVAGHRLSTGAIEEVLAGHPAVAECAVIGVEDSLKGMLPLGLVVLKSGVTQSPEAVVSEVVAKVRAEIGPVAAFKTAVVVDRLPKTRSGKILRGTMKKLADGESISVPATIDDPAILDEIRQALAPVGYGGTS